MTFYKRHFQVAATFSTYVSFRIHIRQFRYNAALNEQFNVQLKRKTMARISSFVFIIANVSSCFRQIKKLTRRSLYLHNRKHNGVTKEDPCLLKQNTPDVPHIREYMVGRITSE